ncbi:MAG: type II toxin-antitoxin system RelE/ParE family toxin [Methyloglobulus sp.]|nr:type II toxin-antitoxin system RelE/ParE family toxin [Methyloglobulus sp.]
MNTKRIQILSDANNDLEEGPTVLRETGQKCRDYFWDSLLSDIESLVIFAGIHRKEFGFHRMLSKRFPYAIYYDVNGDVAFIIAVLPIRRNPVWIKTRISAGNQPGNDNNQK